MSPAKWGERAGDLASPHAVSAGGGQFQSFNRLSGCRGGVLMIGGLGAADDWALLYYDASRDAITDTVRRADVQAKMPTLQLTGAHGFGVTADGRQLMIGADSLMIPPGVCGLSGWEFSQR